MNVLIACEQSQKICLEFRRKDHIAFSCDLLECGGGYPGYHINGDCTGILGAGYFYTQDGNKHFVPKWDLLIAHPPCTYLSTVGNRQFSLKCNTPDKVADRIAKRENAARFFMLFVESAIEHICIENPVGYMNTHYRKPDQIIHPYYFADGIDDIENYNLKRTCLWLYNLPLLKRTNYLPKPDPLYICAGEKNKR